MPLVKSVVSAQALAVQVAASGKFAAAMEPGCAYEYCCEVDSWITVGATGGSAAADTANNVFVKAGTREPLANLEDSGKTNSFVHAIGQTAGADGDATLTQYRTKLV